MGTQEILIVLLVGVVLFGAKKLPELARSFGVSIREFKKAVGGDEAQPSPPAPPAATSTVENHTEAGGGQAS